jgi:cytosine/uracil/thiamine/allantoin permease
VVIVLLGPRAVGAYLAIVLFLGANVLIYRIQLWMDYALYWVLMLYCVVVSITTVNRIESIRCIWLCIFSVLAWY